MSTEYIGLIMYDLPMQTDNEILRYKNFRKKLIEKGYYQLQKSVYIIRSKTKEKIRRRRWYRLYKGISKLHPNRWPSLPQQAQSRF